MSLGLGKLLAQAVMPLSLAFWLLALAALAMALGRRRLAGAALAVAGLELALASSPALSERLAAALERRHLAPPLAEIPPADAILLLGGAIEPALPPRDFPELSAAGDRVVHTARLFAAGKAPLVVVSGGLLPWQRGRPPEAAGLTEFLTLLGVPHDAIVREERSANTYENCTLSKALLDARGASDVLLVTSALHMPRALATCRSAGLSVRPAPTDFWVAGAEAETLALLPEAQALQLTHLALHEHIGLWVYRRRGWIREAP